MLTASASNGSNIKRLEDGVYTAQCIGIIDEGNQLSEAFNKISRKVRIIWNILGETFTDSEGNEKPYSLSKEYSLSLNDRSTLRADLQAWRGQAFTEEELKGFNLINILGKPCQLQIMNVTRNDKTYTNISAIMALPKGMQVPAPEATYTFDLDDEATYCNYLCLQEFVQKIIQSSENFEGSPFQLWLSSNNSDDLPF